MYAQAAPMAAVEPLNEDDPAVIANAILTGALSPFATVH